MLCWSSYEEPIITLTMTLCLQPKLFFITENVYETYKIFYHKKWDGSNTFSFHAQQ